MKAWAWLALLAVGFGILIAAEACRAAPPPRPRRAREVHRQPPSRPVVAREPTPRR
ncbi:MAG: hypothetical protein JNM17_01465 [Archangium sp.]|nr:hypothetical protein [Archangium sp.]